MTEIRLSAGIIELNGEPIAKLNEGIYEPHIKQEFDCLYDVMPDNVITEDDMHEATDWGRKEFAKDAIKMIKTLGVSYEDRIIKKLEHLV